MKKRVMCVHTELVREGSVLYEGKDGNTGITTTEEAAGFAASFFGKQDKELLYVCAVNGELEPVLMELVAKGSKNVCYAEPADIFKSAIMANTAKFILLQKNLNLIMHLKQGKLRNGKATADLQRDLDEQGIGDLIEDDTEEANFQAEYNGEYYEIECIDISGLEEDAEVHLKNGDEIEVKEIIDILEKRKNSKADKEFEEELDNCLLRNVKGYTIS